MDGRLSDDWRAADQHAGRFLIGSDTWITQRWQHYEALFADYRHWLGELPLEAAQRIAGAMRPSCSACAARLNGAA